MTAKSKSKSLPDAPPVPTPEPSFIKEPMVFRITANFGAVIPLAQYENIQPELTVEVLVRLDADQLASAILQAQKMVQNAVVQSVIPVVENQLKEVTSVSNPSHLFGNLYRTRPAFHWLACHAPDAAQSLVDDLVFRVGTKEEKE